MSAVDDYLRCDPWDQPQATLERGRQAALADLAQIRRERDDLRLLTWGLFLRMRKAGYSLDEWRDIRNGQSTDIPRNGPAIESDLRYVAEGTRMFNASLGGAILSDEDRIALDKEVNT